VFRNCEARLEELLEELDILKKRLAIATSVFMNIQNSHSRLNHVQP
jgi:hypothetical protein